jgi:putative ATPase
MRPRTLDEVVGQQHFLGEGKLLRRLIQADRLGSVIFYGPPGTGKTTLAQLLAAETKSRFRQLNATTSGVKELREVLEEARDHLAAAGQRTMAAVRGAGCQSRLRRLPIECVWPPRTGPSGIANALSTKACV